MSSDADRATVEAAIVADLRDHLARGRTVDESRQLRRQLVRSTLAGLGGIGIATAALAVVTGFDGGFGLLPFVFAVMTLGNAGVRYHHLRPRSPEVAREQELAALASLYSRCRSCDAIMGRLGLACPSCGLLRRPRAAAVAVTLLALGTVAMLVWLWLRTGRG